MANTSNANLVKISNMIYKEWYNKTTLVQSCDNSFEGELNLKTRELDIRVYHDLTIHTTSLKERELKPAAIEFMKSSTKRVTIDKGRYTHWGDLTISELVDDLTQEKSVTRQKLATKWAREAEEELAKWVVFTLPSAHLIDMPTRLAWSTTKYIGTAASVGESVIKVLDVLKAVVIANKMDYSEFTLFASEALEGAIRDQKLVIDSLSNDVTFRKGTVGVVNDIDIRKIHIPALVTRNTTSGLIEAEYAIWKTRDGIQYVVPYKNTVEYELQKSEILLGGTGHQTIEYYDFFNLYPTRLYRVPLYYKANPSLPTL